MTGNLVRWTIDLCLDATQREDAQEWGVLFECFDDEPAARIVYYALISLGLKPECVFVLYPQDRSGIGWFAAVEVARSAKAEKIT